MQFCSDCGSVLNIFEFPDEELCYTCRKDSDLEQKPEKPQVQQQTFSADSLREATLNHENNQLILRSPEGWILWSGPDSSTPSFGKIIDRAETILKIRQRRKKQ